MNSVFCARRDRLDSLVIALQSGLEPDESHFEITDIEFNGNLVNSLVYAALDRFAGDDDDEKGALDSFLAPRLHAAIRLSRNDAANHLIWAWVASVPMSKYMRKRWPLGEDDQEKKKPGWRYVDSNLMRNGIARLWWAGEILRSGPDYKLVEAPLRGVYAFQSVSELKYSWHREFTRAFARVCLDQQLYSRGSKVVKELSKRVNLYAKTQAIEGFDDEVDEGINSIDKDWYAVTPTLSELTCPVEELVGPRDGFSRQHVEEHLYSWISQVAAELT
jgi:hypothetical protein